jgi:hypothetical protein
MITQGQEISAYGNYGFGNDNDNWILKCQSRKDGQDFFVGETFELVH